MLVGYVSNERYIALDDVLLEFESETESTETRSRATGAVYADVQPGDYKVTLRKDGYGAKSVLLTIRENESYQFRLLSNKLVGYMWPKWVRSGEKSEYRVHSVEAYRLDLYRYGWDKEQIRPIGWFDEHGPLATMQISPDGDYTQTGIQFNKFGYSNNPHHRQYVTAPEKSGLYYLHAKTVSGEFFTFPWIVAPATPQSDIAVLASNINWNAYNNFGGRSNYIHPIKMPPQPTVNARLDLLRYTSDIHMEFTADEYAPLSFDRPELFNHIPEETRITDPVEGRSECHVLPAEWRLFGWLEREGYNHDLYTETQFHTGVLNLDKYKVLIISTHPEYWSREMYFGLKEWVFERGGKLLYLGGNGLNCAVEFLDESTMTVRNGPEGGSSSDLARIGKESRMDVYYESEANLLGVRCTEEGIMTGAPYRAVDTSHWIFEGTGLKDGDIFGEKGLHGRCSGGASGHETDKMSAGSPRNCRLLAKGLNPDDGGAEIVYHETDSGGAVFSVGSISYPCSLPVDEKISKITGNVIERFVQ
jgi:N,N-dimethylformamidase